MKKPPPMVLRLRRIAVMARQVANAMQEESERKMETLKKIQEVRRG